MISGNPLAELRKECEALLKGAMGSLRMEEALIKHFAFEKPPVWEFGQLATSICFELAKQAGEKPLALAQRLVQAVDKARLQLVKEVSAAGGYINFHVNFEQFSALTIESVRKLDAEYGLVKVEKPQKIIVEHTSVNPLHPIHIGQARNPMLGDALARMLSARGHTVFRHYYVDDVGRQTAVIAYGYEKLGKPKPTEKPDHFIGKIYTVTSCLVEINRLKRELERAKMVSADEEMAKISRELDDWVSVAFELKQKCPDLFERLLEKIGEDPDPEKSISELNKAYETGDERAKRLIREVSQLCLEGFKETLSRAGVFYDSWDWESDLVWSGLVAEALRKLRQTPFVTFLGGVLEFEAGKVVDVLALRERLGLRKDYEVPSLTLVRADGTTLYTTRDIAYTLWKFNKADKCINVIGMEQSLAQLQLKIALYALGFKDYAENLVHFAYNLVTLPGYKMSSRRGRYITLDEVLDEATRRAYEEVSKRSPQLSDEGKRKVAEIVGIGAVRYALVEVDPAKPVEFNWDRVLNFEKNSAPYIQYSHARACSILRKAARKPEKPDYRLLKEKLEQELVFALAEFPETFVEAVETLKPNLIADYANALADKFNTFYNAFPVIKAEPLELSDARLALVDAVRIVLRNSLNLVGITAPERM
ncbi:MAG: arginine--tRNA ligase [Candidatus Bathyarchaeota archaeon]|nr:arginine--tRNA ligase [Candidatus Bathyarchaeota archaeon]MDW8040111.1 arginine--tRNA ligase [Nitrososphaerota archaeon]